MPPRSKKRRTTTPKQTLLSQCHRDAVMPVTDELISRWKQATHEKQLSPANIVCVEKAMFYSFQSSRKDKARNWKKVNANRTWELIRYDLEVRLGIIKFQPRLTQGAFLTGIRYGSTVPLVDNDFLENGAVVVLKRNNMPKYLHAYVPPSMLEDTLTNLERAANVEILHKLEADLTWTKVDDLSEDEKLQRIMNYASFFGASPVTAPVVSAATRRIQRSRIQHPSSYKTHMRNGCLDFIPPKTYKCRSCNTLGDHFRSTCRRLHVGESEGGARPIDDQRLAVGIPNKWLRPATENEKKLCTFMISPQDGSAVVLKASKHLKSEGFLPVSELAAEKVKAEQALDKNTYNFEEEDVPEFEIEEYLLEKDIQEKMEERAFFRANPECQTKIPSICTHWMRGLCKLGARSCQYMHVYEEIFIPICKFYMEDQCGSGKDCVFRHPPKGTEDEKKKICPCFKYNAGYCPFGLKCVYSHITFTSPFGSTLKADVQNIMMDIIEEGEKYEDIGKKKTELSRLIYQDYVPKVPPVSELTSTESDASSSSVSRSPSNHDKRMRRKQHQRNVRRRINKRGEAITEQ
jgi:hypothetical protein